MTEQLNKESKVLLPQNRATRARKPEGHQHLEEARHWMDHVVSIQLCGALHYRSSPPAF